MTDLQNPDAQDRLVTVCQGASERVSVQMCTGGKKRSFLYSSTGFLVSADNPETGPAVISYHDGAGNLKKIGAVEQAYDGEDRMTSWVGRGGT